MGGWMAWENKLAGMAAIIGFLILLMPFALSFAQSQLEASMSMLFVILIIFFIAGAIYISAKKHDEEYG